jgi:AcrR family transcriptional regulator
VDVNTDGDPGHSAEPPDALSPAVRRLWAQSARPRRGPKPALTLDQIAEAATQIADAEGLAAVSMARVAEALGYSSMALYRYVSSKEELLGLMADAVASPPPDLSSLDGWRARLERWTLAQLEMVLQRPWYLDLPLASALPGPRRTMWIEAAFAALADVAVDVDTKFRIVGLLAQHVLGEARVELDGRRAAAEIVRRVSGLPADTPDADLDPQALAAANPYAGLELLFARLADPARYPALSAALRGFSPEPGSPGTSWQAEVTRTLAIVLDGIEVLVLRHTEPA